MTIQGRNLFGAWMMQSSVRPLRLRRFFVSGLVGGILATIILYVVTGVLNYPFPPLAIFQLLIAPVPGSIQSVMVETFGEYAKYSAFIVSSGMYSIMYGLIAVALGIAFKGNLQGKSQKALVVAVAVPTAISLGLQASLASAFPAISSATGWILAAVVAVVVNIIFAQTFIAYSTVSPTVAAEQKPMTPMPQGRRGFLKKVLLVLIGLGLVGVAADFGLDILSKQPVVTSGTSVPINPQATQATLALNQTSTTSTSSTSSASSVADVFADPRISGLVASEVTDTRVFYRVDINPIPPQLDFDTWSLLIHGKVNNSLKFDKNSILQQPTTDEYATLECVSNTISPPSGLISNAKWTGVPLATLLKQTGLQSDSNYVIFRSADGYSVGVPIARALEAGALLAYKMNDVSLPPEHGFPLRAIVPGIYGMMNAKWVTDIEVSDQVYLGYWQERGWSNDARIKTTSIIYYPTSSVQVNTPTPIAGVAFAGDRGISKVEVSVDGGNTWNQAVLRPPKSPYSWVLWAYMWTPTTSGTATIVTRATDGTGTLQASVVTNPFPNGATGYSSSQINVT
ncbi:MAG TPA: molybdopterin-dependent oxidoreductase [Candidatus Acidoferrales bacterium]|nr:molybdopterin-dependent oxidoreductase [Candidatus Acidoferrales bacterium]